MKKYFQGFLFLVACAMANTAWAATDEFVEDIHYEQLDNPQPTGDPGKVEVLEAFWYGCPHCYDLEGDVNHWLKNKPEDVSFIRFPAIPTPRWEWYATVFYTAQVLGVADKIHSPLFEAIHEKKKRLSTPEEMASFFEQYGVKKEDFHATLKSFAVVTRINQARQLTRRFGLSSVPAVIINGKYRTTARLAGGNKQMLDVVDFSPANSSSNNSLDSGRIVAESKLK